MTRSPLDDPTEGRAPRPTLPGRARWTVVAGLSLLALPVTFSFFFFGIVAADGCVPDCAATPPRPLLAAGLGVGAAVMGGGWAGLVPWALGRTDLVGRTAAAGAVLVAGLFALVATLG